MLLHERPDFAQLIMITSDKLGIAPSLVEKDYWIMHCLWGLQEQGFTFELKGGTSLSKGYGIIQRFSEDIDIRVEPPHDMNVVIGRNHDKAAHIETRKTYYDWLAQQIDIPGIVDVSRDHNFDDVKMRSAGIRLSYKTTTPELAGLKEGVLLELGFDDTTPNRPVDISSWAFEHASQYITEITDNRAKQVLCYSPAYTFVEKLQTISTKYRLFKANGAFPANFLRHYYDVYCLLENPEVLGFTQTPQYVKRKQERFRKDDELLISNNPAFQLKDAQEKELFEREYKKTADLYYQGQPSFNLLLERIWQHIKVL
jgi:hypothetical protein